MKGICLSSHPFWLWYMPGIPLPFSAAYEYEGEKIKALLYAFLIELRIWLATMIVCYTTSLAKAKIQQKLKNKLRSIISKIAFLDSIQQPYFF